MVLKTSTEIQVDFNASYPVYEPVLCWELLASQYKLLAYFHPLGILLTTAKNSYTVSE